ncbi:MAG: pH regulation protein F [Candidatus Rokubacteria bacterium]|jgi:multicomponent Na+:H+ antiporter subunit F|nr:pH regulation protein F [Betaproteobacteria bacterium]MBM4441092.1 pH regulation protein F [Candidatus Rokubacteria bacterium]
MYEVAVAALLLTIALALVRGFLGPTVFDRALAVNAVGTISMLLLAVISFMGGRPEFLDLAIVYGFLNLIGTVAVLKYFRYGSLGEPGEEGEPR